MVVIPIMIAGIIIPAIVAFVAPLFVEFVKEKVKERKESLADLHEVLEKGLEWLFALQRDNENKVWGNIIQKDPSEVYLHWKQRVSNIKEVVASLKTKYEEEEKKEKECWRLFHKVRKARLFNEERDELKEDIKRALSDVIKLLGEEYPKEILVDKLPERVIKEPGVPSIAKYETLNKAFQSILNLLQDKGVKCVALHGQKGVGKTTIMRHLNNHHFSDNSVDKEFDMVIFIKLAADEQTQDLHILQKIADRINVDREVNDFDEVARRIQQKLENKRYLLILDGVRDTPDGIWEKLDISKEEKDSKVVITTHYPLAMKSNFVDRKVELKPLSPKETLTMFQDIVGSHVPQEKAILICKRFCSCLPLLIHPIARSFKYQEAPVDWQRALNEWMSWAEVGVEGLDELLSKLEICYERLCDRSKQKCFLYASLYPANSKIYTDYFVECCIVQGFLDDVDANTYREMRRRAIDIILRHLVNVAFLEEGEGGQMRYVKMNDLYRQLALYISSKYLDLKCTTYVDNEEHEERPFRPESWQQGIWVSMIGSKRNSLPTNQNGGSLRTVLLLQKNLRLVEIQPDYFESMSNLLVLNLYGTRISKLPSLKGLTGLKAFYLNGCSKLELDSREIQPLQHLEVFDIRGTRANFVPCLKSLWCLRISYTASGDYHKISELHNLEELIIEVEKQFRPQWEIDAQLIERNAALRNITLRLNSNLGWTHGEVRERFEYLFSSST